MELDAIIAEFIDRDRGTRRWSAGGHDVIVGPVNDYPEAFADPQVRHNEMVVEVEHHSGPLRVHRSPGASLEHARVGAPPSAGLGEHTDEVLRELGLPESLVSRVTAGGTR